MSLKTEYIARKVRVFSDTYANLPTTGVATEDMGYATDRKVLYRWSGAAWETLTIYASSGTAAAIPAAANLPNGSVYYETDTALLKQVQAGAWVIITHTINFASGGYAGNGADDRQIAVGFACKLVILRRGAAGGYAIYVCMSTLNTVYLPPGAAISVQADLTLHATDGFVVDAVTANGAGENYTYVAIG